MAVQQHVLNWLYSVLTSEYHDVNRTYNDVAQALSQYPSLSPRTDVHTFPNGVSALLLHLSGTIPVPFRGATYRFPISLWIPHAYPRDAPIVYVTPTETMSVRPGQHVDPQGMVYHPYLVGWAEFSDRSSLTDFLAILRDIFAIEPPVIARQSDQTQPSTAQQQAPTLPPLPPLPPDMTSRPSNRILSPTPSQGPPPPVLPPKGNDVPLPHSRPPPLQRGTAPPVPPSPLGPGRFEKQHGLDAHDHRQPKRPASRYNTAPPLPPQAGIPQSRPSAYGGNAEAAGISYQAQPQQPSQYRPDPASNSFPHTEPSRASLSAQPQQYSRSPNQWQQSSLPQQRSQPPPKAPPPPDIMDEPLTLSIPPPSDMPAPPIPPNPEKDALLHQLAQTLHAMRQRSRAQNESSMGGLQAQRTAMLNALSTLQSEAAAVTHLMALLASNTAILRDALRTADGVIENSARQSAPGIDELLVAPNVVANQLYDLVAEERALADAIFVLGRAVERGRVTPAVFAKMTRSVARERYLKKALVHKLSRGMGLAP